MIGAFNFLTPEGFFCHRARGLVFASDDGFDVKLVPAISSKPHSNLVDCRCDDRVSFSLPSAIFADGIAELQARSALNPLRQSQQRY